MSVRDNNKKIIITNGITGEVKTIDYNINGMGLFSINIKDYLLLMEIKNCINNSQPCRVDTAYKPYGL